MQASVFRLATPGLLVSVRNAAEAAAALAGGADVIDVKEPARGSLGAADVSAINAVITAVNRVRPVTAAMGELLDWCARIDIESQRQIPEGVIAFKLGLAGCAKQAHWQSDWREAVLRLRCGPDDGPPYPVAVAYADWRAAQAPNPSDVLNAARELGCPVVLVDTWDKSSGTLFDHWQPDDLRAFVETTHHANMSAVLAGSLDQADMSIAASLGPDLIAVRTAACEGGRNGTVSTARVRELNRAAQTAPHSDSPVQAFR